MVRNTHLESRHLFGDVERRRCSQWRRLWFGDASMPADLVATWQRCASFTKRLEVPTDTKIVLALNNHEEINHAED